MEGRRQSSSDQQSRRTSHDLIFTSTPSSASSFLAQPGGGFVNGGGGAHNGTFVTHVDLHHAPAEPTREQRQCRPSPADEPEPDYDAKDVENDDDDDDGGGGGSILVDGRLPRPKEVVGYGEPPTPPPLPPPSTLGYSAGLQLTTRGQSRDRVTAESAEVAAARQRDEAHAALMAAVQRRRHLLDSVDGELIADSIESRVQRSRMLQTVYKADDAGPAAAAPAVQRCESATPAAAVVERPPVGLLGAGDATSSPAAAAESNGGGEDFTMQAEQARLRYVRRLHHPPPPPLTKPLRAQPPTAATKSLQNGGAGGQAAGVEPPPVPRRSVVVHESHNRALAAYVNGSSKVYTAPATAAGDVDDTAARAFVRLSDVGESTTETEPSPSTGACPGGDRRLRVVTDDAVSVLSSLSTLSTNSSGVVGAAEGATSPHGSPSQSSSGDSGFAKSSVSTTDAAATAIIPPPTEFASSSPSDNASSSSSSSASVLTTVPSVTALRSVARNQSHSIVFPARTQLATQK